MPRRFVTSATSLDFLVAVASEAFSIVTAPSSLWNEQTGTARASAAARARRLARGRRSPAFFRRRAAGKGRRASPCVNSRGSSLRPGCRAVPRDAAVGLRLSQPRPLGAPAPRNQPLSSLSPSHFLAPRGVSASPCMSSAAPWNPPLLQGVLDDIKSATRTRFGSHRHRPAWPHHEDLASLRPRVAIRTPCSDVVTPSWRQESRLSRKARRRPPRSHTREGKAETEISPAVTPPPSTWPEPKQNIGNPCH